MNPTYILRGVITARQPLATCGPSLSKSVKTSEPKPVPTMACATGKFMFMPGSGIRSKLRGALLSVVREAYRDNTGNATPFSVDDHAVLRIGGVKQGGTEIGATAMEMAELRETNPIISLFGAATPWVTGKLHVGCAIDEKAMGGTYGPITVDGVRNDPVRRDAEAVEFIDPATMDSYFEQLALIKANSLRKAELDTLTKAFFEAKREKRTADQAAIDVKRKAIEKAIKANAAVSAQMPLSGYEAIPTGATLKQDLRLLQGSEVELGALLAALDSFAAAPLLGAHVAHGCGEISGVWEVTRVTATGGRTAREDVGTVKLLPFEGLSCEGKVLVEAREAFDAFLTSPRNLPKLKPEWMKAAKAGATQEEAEAE